MTLTADETATEPPERCWVTAEEMGKIPLGGTVAKVLRVLETGV